MQKKYMLNCIFISKFSFGTSINKFISQSKKDTTEEDSDNESNKRRHISDSADKESKFTSFRYDSSNPSLFIDKKDDPIKPTPIENSSTNVSKSTEPSVMNPFPSTNSLFSTKNPLFKINESRADSETTSLFNIPYSKPETFNLFNISETNTSTESKTSDYSFTYTPNKTVVDFFSTSSTSQLLTSTNFSFKNIVESSSMSTETKEVNLFDPKSFSFSFAPTSLNINNFMIASSMPSLLSTSSSLFSTTPTTLPATGLSSLQTQSENNDSEDANNEEGQESE